jgi:hypothetical protein
VIYCAGCSGSTLVISGATTSVTLKHCQFLCCSTAILSGASAALADCHFKGSSRPFDSLAMLATGHDTHVALSSCTFTSWDEAVVVDGGAAVEMHGGCEVSHICWCGVSARGARSYLSMTDVGLFDVGFGRYGQHEDDALPAAVAAFNGAKAKLNKCRVANKNACAGLLTSTAPHSFGVGLAAWDHGTHVEAKDSEFRGCSKGVVMYGQARMQLDKCTVANNKDANVYAFRGAVLGLTGCTVVHSLENCGLAAQGKSTCVDAKETTFQGNFLHGVSVCDHARLQLDKCMVARNKDANVFAAGGAVLGLMRCTVVASLENCGLAAQDKGTRVDAKETTFQENFQCGVGVCDYASVQLDKCKVASNKDSNVFAFRGAVLGLNGCTVVDSLENCGLSAQDKGTRVYAKESTFQDNFLRGVAARNDASVQLDKCRVASNKDANVFAFRGAVLGLNGCRVVDSLENCGLAAQDKGTRVNAKETTFQGNFLRGGLRASTPACSWTTARWQATKMPMCSLSEAQCLA